MSALVGAISKDITFNPVMEKEEKNKNTEPTHDDPEKTEGEGHEDDEDDETEEEDTKQKKALEKKELELGPQFSLKEQLEKDKVFSLSVFMLLLKCTLFHEFSLLHVAFKG